MGDQAALTKTAALTEDLHGQIDTWLEDKRKNEVDPVRLRPHPYEFFLYFDA